MVTEDNNNFDPTKTEFLGIISHVQGESSSPQFCRIQPTHRQFDNSWYRLQTLKPLFPILDSYFGGARAPMSEKVVSDDFSLKTNHIMKKANAATNSRFKLEHPASQLKLRPCRMISILQQFDVELPRPN